MVRRRKRRRKDKGRRKIVGIILLVVSLLFLLFAGLIIYGVVKDLGQEDILKQEIINYSNMDLARDDYSIYVKTKGDYAYIEEAVKKFYKELSDNVKTINYYMNDEELKNILSPDSLLKDRPNFANSFSIIEKDRTKVSNALKKISELCEKDTVKKLIDKEKIDDYSYDLYKKLMLTKDDIDDLKNTKQEMEYISKNLDLFFDKEIEILKFFKNNNSSWEYKDNQLYFATEELVNKYNTLYKELMDIANKFEVDNNRKSNTKDNKVTA